MNSIEKLKNIFSKFPGVGPRTAGRFVYYLLKLPEDMIREIIASIEDVRSKTKTCQKCFNVFESGPEVTSDNQTICPICRNSTRNKNFLCIIEKEADLQAIEKTGKYAGLYFILGEIKSMKIEELKNRIKSNSFSEIIIALNPTAEGRTSSVLVEKAIKDIFPSPTFKITHLAMGIPVGGELEYADEETLGSALEGRK